MADYVVESVFKQEGFICVVILHKMAHRCGYVGVPKTHPLYGKDYEKADKRVEVHGGLTYSNSNPDYPIKSYQKLWWFGFDCAHLHDAPDYDAAIKKMPEHAESLKIIREIDGRFSRPGDTIKTKEYVKEECRSLARQLKVVEGWSE